MDALPAEFFSNVPEESILGINYSGRHDSAIAIVGPDGRLISACALERISRSKQDGRPPTALLAHMPWKNIAAIATSTDRKLWFPADPKSALHPLPLPQPRTTILAHESPFYEFFDSLPLPTEFICHQLSHAASAFYLSGFDESLCFTYDGGIPNSPWFGALYMATKNQGISALDHFAATHYAKISSLYSLITALLGFTPNKHEGKVTGLAGFGKPVPKCRDILNDFLFNQYLDLENMADWAFAYSKEIAPFFSVNEARRKFFSAQLADFTREDVAASLQQLSEEHIVQILKNASDLNWTSENICLAGGLFANVKINQRVREFGFEKVFVAPPMTDDGTAAGAALALAASRGVVWGRPVSSMFLGYRAEPSLIEETLQRTGVTYRRVQNAAAQVAADLAAGKLVGIFTGSMEYGPRALGHRSILSQATRTEINHELNLRLRRTEFMPFAPITRAQDAHLCYRGIKPDDFASEYMTVTYDCTDLMKMQSPAVVHVDGTARPQIVQKGVNPLMHDILTHYEGATGIPSLINTSFNVHEEPIVCTPADAVQGFLEAGLDVLYLEGGFYATLNDNLQIAYETVRARLGKKSQHELELTALNTVLFQRNTAFAQDLDAKERLIDEVKLVANQRSEALRRKEEALNNLHGAMEELRRDLSGKDDALRELHTSQQSLQHSLLEKDKALKKMDADASALTQQLHEAARANKELSSAAAALSAQLEASSAESGNLASAVAGLRDQLLEKDEALKMVSREFESVSARLHARVHALEADLTVSQRETIAQQQAAQQRLRIIEELDEVAKERLDIIRSLNERLNSAT